MFLVMDFRCRNQQLMRDTEKLKEWLIEATHKAKMTPFGEPQVHNYPFPGIDGVALSGVIFLGESSILIHTYPEGNFVSLDIYSCKEIGEEGEEALREFVKESFEITEFHELPFDRGVNLKTGEAIPARLRRC